MNEPRVKAAVRARDGFRCTKCGMTNDEHLESFGRSLHVHRLKPGSVYTVDDCVTLCSDCHAPEPKSPRRRPSADETTRILQVRVPHSLLNAMEYLAAEHRRPVTTEVAIAFTAYIRSLGYEPPEWAFRRRGRRRVQSTQ